MLIAVLFLSACKSNTDVVSDGVFQKRKHRPGFHLNLGPKPTLAVQPVATSKKQPLNFAAATEGMEEKDNAPRRRLSKMPKSTAKLVSPSNPIMLPSNRPMPIASCIEEAAQERTEELEELQVAEERNKKNLRLTLLLNLGALLTILFAIISFPFIGGAVGLLAVVAVYLLFFTVPIFFIYLIERGRLRKGELFFNEARIKKWSKFTDTMQRLQRFSFAGLIIAFIAALFIVGQSLFLGAVIIIASIVLALLYYLGTWLGIISGTVVRNLDPNAKLSLRKIYMLVLFSFLLSALAIISTMAIL